MYTLKIIYKNGRYSFYDKRYGVRNAAMRCGLRQMKHNAEISSVEIWETAKLPAMYL